MPRFLWTGKYPGGQSFAQNVEAPTAMAARARLEAQGCTELQLREDDFASTISGLFKGQAELPAAQRLHLRDKGRATVGEVIWTSLKTFPLASAVFAAVVALNILILPSKPFGLFGSI